MPGWLDSAPALTAEQTRLVDIATGRPLRDRADLGRRPPHRLLHVHACCATTARAEAARRAAERPARRPPRPVADRHEEHA